MGFTVESNTAVRPPYSLSFIYPKDINQYNWDTKKEYSCFDVSNTRFLI